MSGSKEYETAKGLLRPLMEENNKKKKSFQEGGATSSGINEQQEIEGSCRSPKESSAKPYLVSEANEEISKATDVDKVIEIIEDERKETKQIPKGRKVMDHNGQWYVLGSKKHAKSVNHLMTHNGKNKHCRACKIAKAQRKQRRSKGKTEKVDKKEGNFGDNITMDAFTNHKYNLTYMEQSLDPYKYALIIHDIATKWTEGYASGRKTKERTLEGLAHFLGKNNTNVKNLYSDGQTPFMFL